MEFERLQPAWKARKTAIEEEFASHPAALTSRLAKELLSSDLGQAADAAEAIGWLRLEFAITDLVKLLGHEDEWLRDRASFALGRMPRNAAPYLAIHGPTFSGPAFEHTVKAFVRMKLAAIPTLVEMLASGQSGACELAHKALCQIKFPLEDLSQVLSSPNTQLRILAIDVLGKSRDAAAVEILANLPCDFPECRQKVAVAMARLARHFPEKLHEKAGKPMPYLYLQALAKAGDEAAWDELQFQLGNSAKHPQAHLIKLLRNFPQKPMQELLESLIQTAEAKVLKAVLDVLAHNRRAAFIPLLLQLKQAQQDPNIAEAAQKVLDAYHKQGILPT